MFEDVGAQPPTYWTEVIDISRKLKERSIVEYPIIDAWGQGKRWSLSDSSTFTPWGTVS